MESIAVGAMGYGVYDNDDAMDFAGSLVQGFWGKLTGSPEQVRVIADLMYGSLGNACILRGAPDTGQLESIPFRKVVTEELEAIPDEWFEDWEDPDLMHYEVNSTIRKLKGLEA